MAVAFDAAASGSAIASSTLSWSHTVTGADTILYVFFGGWDGTGRTATCTYAGTSMTQEAISNLSSGNDRIWCFRLAAPATGTNTVAVTITGGIMHLIGGSLSWTSAHQTVFGTAVTTVSSVSGTSASSDVTDGASGDGIADGVISGDNNTHVVNGPASHTERWDISTGQGEAGAGGNSDGAAGTVTVGWTISASAGWAHAAVTVKQLAGAAAATKRLWRMGLMGVN